MTELVVAAAQHSIAGIKLRNEDSCGIRLPDGPLLTTKGVAVIIADGMSGADSGKEASDICVQGFLQDYYSTPESWTVKTSVQRVLGALNRWLHGQGHQRFGSERGLVTTVSALIIKSTTAYLFHVGDTRIYRLRDGDLECLTRDHRTQVSGQKTYLTRAMGIDVNIEIDYRTVTIETDDIFILTTDGIHEYLKDSDLKALVSAQPLDTESAAQSIVMRALDNGSDDNLSCQVVRIAALPNDNEDDFYRRLTELPFPPPLEPGMVLDGYRVIEELHASKRTQVYLAVDTETETQVILKTPSVNYNDDPGYIDRFLHEEWVGRRLRSPHTLTVLTTARKRRFLYYVTEHVEGLTLREWMRRHPRPSLKEVRNLIAQVAAGLRAFHRMEMLHQDLKPENILIDEQGTVKIIDFGSTKIAGIEELASPLPRDDVLGTRNYIAPEYLQGYAGTHRSDIFSLGVIAYEMLAGALPYGPEPAVKKLPKLRYTPIVHHNPDVPAWVDGAVAKAVALNPQQRYSTQSEFIQDLTKPNPTLAPQDPLPLLERNPVAFWRGLAIALFLGHLFLIYYFNR